MKEKLYTIPVNDAFHATCECPLCYMKQQLETNAIEFTIGTGTSYMEEDIRAITDEMGFCSNHIMKLYEAQNRLGLALMLKTHMDKTIKDIEHLSANNKISATSIFKKKASSPSVKAYIEQLEHSCFICNKIDEMFKHYVETIFWQYKNDSEFYNKFKNSNGFCTTHYATLYDEAPNHLNSKQLENFISDLNNVYLNNIRRVRDDLSWFIDKFDYRYVNEPWKNSEDALQRSMTKTNSILPNT